MKQETEDVSAIRESTYISFSEVRGLKMPGGSPVRLLPRSCLETTRNEIDQVFRVGSISCLIVPHHHHTTRALIPIPRPRKFHDQIKKTNFPSSSIGQRLYLAASRRARVKKEENNRLEEGGDKRCLHRLRKCVQFCQRSQRVEDIGRQP